MKTVWVLGDQLNTRIGALADASPDVCRVLLVESAAMIRGRPYHRQRLHLVLTAMRRFARELESAGYEVDYRRAASLSAGLREHQQAFGPTVVVATEPNSRAVHKLLANLEVELVRSNQFLCHRDEFAAWASGSKQLLLENFYRSQRRRFGYLMDDDQPMGGRWNFDHDNREPPPADGGRWPEPPAARLDEVDHAVLAELPETAIGHAPTGLWATSRRGALARLRHFVDQVLPIFGPHEDAMTESSWHLAHSLLSPYLNLGLLLPGEVCERVDAAYRAGKVPINSAEGMLRQVLGWREYIWGIYWLWPDQEQQNALGHRRPAPPCWTGAERTAMRCVQSAVDDLDERAYVHHIQRLMILSNFANLYGMEPRAVRDWMRERYIDGADWVMGPNVFGMGLWADGGRMSTKPYVSGGAYVKRMSDHCKACRFDPGKRTGDNACPFTTLYWDFMSRHRDTLQGNVRMARQYHTLDRLKDLPALEERAAQVLVELEGGKL